ncbi:aminotransferase class III-fold pyridoxal phosphate-dependent enzyme [bacterium]|nr:aminotransferase class III-fold pyridoxal phosphate-dependent enzyme [bacterium]NUN44314.1 aminotransferase class III-fold pyridoxal phosphate-dependent enzyme [bacterium]
MTMTSHPLNIANSEKYYQRALPLIPAGTQTLAKGPGQYVNGFAPKYLDRGKGAHVWDVDGNEFIDWTMGVGPLSLGYAYPAVDRAISDQLRKGITFSLMHPLEVEVAELIHDVVPNAECVRFSKTGADVTSAAIRLARAYTGRDKVLCCGYHGWHDWYIGVTDRHLGIPDAVRAMSFTFAYNDIASVEASIDENTACVILEPIVFEEPQDNFLHKLRALCDRHGVLLIFDEMWTGFRIAIGGAQEYFDVHADLACFSKAIANGMPLSVLTGRADIMRLLEKDVFFFTTFGGEALSLAACKATLAELSIHDVPSYLRSMGIKIKDGYNQIAQDMNLAFTKCVGLPFRSMVTFDPAAGNPLEMKSLLQQELIRRGILWGGFHNMSYGHSEADIQTTLAAYAESLEILGKAVGDHTVREKLAGLPIEPVFRKTTNFNTKPAVSLTKPDVTTK